MNKAILVVSFAIAFLVSEISMAGYVVGGLYFPRDTVDLNGTEIKTFLAEQPLTMFDQLFGTSTYFNELKDKEKLEAFYKDTLIDIAMLTSLDPMISLFSSCYTIVKWTGTNLDDVSEEMKAFFALYRAIVNNRYVSDQQQYGELLNKFKEFGRLDTNISKKWLEISEGADIAAKILKWSKYAVLLNSVNSYMLSMDFALDRLRLIHSLIRSYRMEGNETSPLFEEAAFAAIVELEQWASGTNIERFIMAYFDQLDKVTLTKDITEEIALAAIKGAVKATELPAIPALGWGFAIKFSLDTIMSGVKSQEIFSRYILAGDILYWLRKLRNNSVNGSWEHLELALCELYSQMYSAELGKDFFGEKVQKFAVWKSSERKETIEDFESDINTVRGFIEYIFASDEILERFSQFYDSSLPYEKETTTTQTCEKTTKYLLTRGKYEETSDLLTAVRNEYGPTAEIADWAEIKRQYSGKTEELIGELGLGIGQGESVLIQNNGKRYYGTTRHYFLTRFDGEVPSWYLVHDQIDSYTLVLGSWYDVEYRILAKISE
ncbi:hypothetical protein [Mesotoga sp. TolDC]|uniref:hypothetical protein n=1 Tax=Mesotoga sp. TolDC TaxID=1389250 RepID=UPI000DA673EC|nr:hypothetical protein [Mesotoga sp. TolDC]PZC52343.1 hypothetical protein LH53_05425 [Mesotoga sp. TolDC]